MAHKDGVFCDEGFKCKKCKEAWGKPTQIEQLTARVRELEEFKANVVKECASIIKHAHQDIAKQLAASQAYAEQLREALGQAISVFEGYSVNRKPCYDAMEQPHDTSALDAYVEQKVKEAQVAYERAAEAAMLLNFKVEELTRQRDLAVKALEAIAGRRIFIDNLASNVDIAVMTLGAIKESEEN